ncbi:hypothetical protein BB561_005336 [Smittium simulii]|uniref:SH3 domain-containing protein n=1 Tax=Smittium simulii TaxID=133385 RepID=A0A2T9YAW8_9FUNG|nr:hypothetical protein BB561_005336 [Smittium simulii]
MDIMRSDTLLKNTNRDPNNSKYADKVIPKNILEKCKGIAIMTVIKGGFVWSGRVGSGIVIARLPNGSWSAPSAIGTAGVGFGGQIGAQLTDFVMILNTTSAVKAFSHGGNVTLGGNIGVAAGPLGRSAEVSGAIINVAPVFSYSKSKGLFVGVSLEGSIILERKDTNEKFYGKRIAAKDLLSGSVPAPPEANALYRAIELKSGTGNTPNVSRQSSVLSTPNELMSSQASNYGKDNYRHSTPYANTSNTSENNGYGAAPRSYLNNSISYGSTSNNFYSDLTRGDNPPQYESTSNTGTDYPNEKLTPGRNSNLSQSSRRVPPPPPNPPAQQSVSMPKVASALYSFEGQAPGDLSFNKGDKIVIIKSTDTQNDWWEGSCKGITGQFPANYVRLE